MSSEDPPLSRSSRGRPSAAKPLLSPEERTAARNLTYRRSKEKRKESGFIRSTHDLTAELLARIEAYSLHAGISKTTIVTTSIEEFLQSKGF